MIRSEKQLLRSLQAEAAFIDSAFQQLSSIFPFVYKHHELQTEDIPSLLVDIVARATTGQLILFEVRYYPSNTTVDYALYPSIAALKDSVRNVFSETPPLVAVITNTHANEPVQNIFTKARIPLITLAPDAGETKARLQNIFGQFGITFPEFLSEFGSQIEENEATTGKKQSLLGKLKLKLVGYITKLNLTFVIYANVFLSVGLGILLWQTERLLLAEFVVLAGIFFAGGILFFRENIIRDKLLNRYLIVLRDERKLVVQKDVWFLEQHILFKARRKTVESFLFRRDWTGSSQNISITCRDEDGTVLQKNVSTSKALNWSLWELKFLRPLQKGQTRQVVLKYRMPDPAHRAMPYYFITYKNFWRCKEFEYRLSIADDLKAQAVYFVQGIWPDRALKKTKISRNVESNEYVVRGWPEQDSKNSVFSFEWEFKNGHDK